MKNHRILKLFILAAILIDLGLFGYQYFQPKPKPQPKTIMVQNVKYQDFHLEITKLNISTPIIANVDGNNQDAYFKALEGGVAQYAETKKPGEGGNIFIFGHSSFYWWKPGDYKEIFKNLEQIQNGDEIIVWNNKKEYKYKVAETKVVHPDDLSVLDPTPSEQLTLMTCVPVGTDEQRLIVIAKPE